MQSYERLECEFAESMQLDPKNMVVCSSGTAALHLGLQSLNVTGNGLEVIVPNFTMVACARAVAMTRTGTRLESLFVPIFADCNEYDLLLDTRYLSSDFHTQLHYNCVAVMPVHIYGRRCDMATVRQFVSTPNSYGRRIYVIEDMAELHGVAPDDRTDVAAWSFYRNKVIHGEEGGAVYFKNREHAVLARKLRCMGFTDAHDYTHLPFGHNYRLANCLADQIRGSLKNLQTEWERRRELERRFETDCPPGWQMPRRMSPWVYDFRIPGMSADEQNRVVKVLREKGIAVRHGFKPMSTQPEFASALRLGGDEASRASKEVLYFPLDAENSVSVEPEKTFDLIRHTLGRG